MKIQLLSGLLTAASVFGISILTYAGNPQRAGSAGGAELLINPWAQTTGFGNANIASVRGVESSYLNIAGMAHIEKTEVQFVNTQWLVGSGIGISSFGLNQKVGTNGVMGLTVSSFNYGEWEVTTETSPEGTGASIAPNTLVMGLSYAQQFTQSIFGGVNIKVYNSNILNLNVTGLCFDAGVQYHTGDRKEWKFGISLRNVGPAISYRGDGMDLVLPVPHGGYTQTFESRSAAFELPANLQLGGSYDYFFSKASNDRLTFAFSFTSNSFEKDLFHFGVEAAGFDDLFMLRMGYILVDNRFDNENTTAMHGFATGFSVNAPLGKGTDSKFAIDFSYRHTVVFNGIYSIGGRFIL
jgi:hypothetical protein